MKMRWILHPTIALVVGCASYTAVGPGAESYNGLQVQTTRAWNLAPKQATPYARSDSEVLTQDGILLDRIMIIPGIADGKPLFEPASEDQAMPAFREDMLPNEIEELTESSLTKLFGENGAAVETANLRPHRYGVNDGVLFDLSVALSEGPEYRGVAGAFVASERLYLVCYLGAVPYYYEKHLQSALAIIKGVRV